MRYPIAIESGSDDTAFGVVVPDLPGCFSAGDTLDEALINASEAISLWIDTVLDDGGAVPPPGRLESHRANPEFAGWIWALAEVDPALLSDMAERVNITLPARLVRRIDEYARSHHETRSGFLARAAIGAMRPE
jgi:predicted RNase H-like HicB family nuclease